MWPKARLIVELDGKRAHATDGAFHEDRARDRNLIAAGWSPMRVTWAHLHQQSEALEAEIRDALGTGTADKRRFTHTGGG